MQIDSGQGNTDVIIAMKNRRRRRNHSRVIALIMIRILLMTLIIAFWHQRLLNAVVSVHLFPASV